MRLLSVKDSHGTSTEKHPSIMTRWKKLMERMHGVHRVAGTDVCTIPTLGNVTGHGLVDVLVLRYV